MTALAGRLDSVSRIFLGAVWRTQRGAPSGLSPAHG
jgi:hypothetical protein